MNFLKNALFGLIIGIANIIPGVSGGTMAVVLGIYDKAIDSVSNFFSNIKKNFFFLLPLGIGAITGIVLFSTLIKHLLSNYPMSTNFFFLGLILGSIPMIYKRTTSSSFRPIYMLSFLIALAIMLVLTFAFSDFISTELISSLTPLVIIRLILSSALAAACMILPGISGSMVLMILGVYTSILTAISEFNIVFLLPVVVGIGLGLLGGAKVIDVCLRRAPTATYFAILGLIIGSIFPVFRNSGFVFNMEGLAAIIALIAGVFASLLLAQVQKNLN